MRPEDLLRNSPPLIRSIPPAPLRMCKACQKMIARGARTCPHCGKTYTTAGGVLIAIVVALVIAAFVI